MSLYGGVIERVRPRASIENPEIPLSSSAIIEYLDGPKGLAGVRVNEKSAMGLPAVWRAVLLNAGTCAALPLHAHERNDEERKQLDTGELADLLFDPHPDLTSFEFWEIIYSHIMLWGNAYIRVLRNAFGTAVELWILHPSRVRCGRANDSEIGKKVYSVDGGEYAYTDKEILHIPGFGYDGVCGVSPIRAMRQGLSLAIAAEEFGARFYGNGSLASGILQTEQRLSEDSANKILRRWKQKQAGLSNAHDVIVLDNGAKFEQLSIPPGDAQFIESRQFQITEVGRMFGVPPFLLYETQKSTSWGTGLEQQAIGWVKFDLNRWYMRVEQRLTKYFGNKRQFAKYGVEGLLRGDSAARAALYTAMWNLGAYSTNEIRAFEDKPPVEGGDVRYRPLNMGELGKVDDADPNAAPPPAPPTPPVPAPDEDDETDSEELANARIPAFSG